MEELLGLALEPILNPKPSSTEFLTGPLEMLAHQLVDLLRQGIRFHVASVGAGCARLKPSPERLRCARLKPSPERLRSARLNTHSTGYTAEDPAERAHPLDASV